MGIAPWGQRKVDPSIPDGRYGKPRAGGAGPRRRPLRTALTGPHGARGPRKPPGSRHGGGNGRTICVAVATHPGTVDRLRLPRAVPDQVPGTVLASSRGGSLT